MKEIERKAWNEFIEKASKLDGVGQARELAEVIGSPIDVDKPYPEIVDILCDKVTVSKDADYFYFKITSPRVKEVHTLGAGGVVTLKKISKESLQSLSTVPVSTPLQYMPIDDVMSAKGYDAIATMKLDATASMDLAEIQKLFAVLDASVPALNKFTLSSGKTIFTFDNLKDMRSVLKNYASKFLLLTGFNVDEDIIGWDYDENKYRSIADMVKDLNVEIKYVGNYTLATESGNKSVIDADVAYLIGMNSGLDGKPFVFARKEVKGLAIPNVEVDSTKQRILNTTQLVVNIAGVQTAVFGYWAHEEMNVVCRLPLALAKFTRE